MNAARRTGGGRAGVHARLYSIQCSAMKITIRYARENDLDAIVEIMNQAIRTHSIGILSEVTVEERREWFHEHAPDEYPIAVAEHDKTVIGWASISPYRKGREALHATVEVSYFIHADYQRQGVGSALLVEMIRISKMLKKSVLLAIVLHTNSGSSHLLEKHDFMRWGVMPEVAEINGRKINHVYYGRKL